MRSEVKTAGIHTHREIRQQPELWQDTLRRVRRHVQEAGVVITGAGTSAHAAEAVASAWPGARAVPSTDLLLDCGRHLGGEEVLISLARSGDSPESVGVVTTVQKHFPKVKHLAITCNAEGGLARQPGVETIVLDPRTNDRSLVMTSSFSNLTLAGLCLRHADVIAAALPAICSRVESSIDDLEGKAREVARCVASRVAVLASPPLAGASREAALKILEMTGGSVVALAESYLGLRHGPMSYVLADTVVLCFLSSDPRRRRYEEDLLAELRAKRIGRIVEVPSAALELPDGLRAPFDIVFAQLVGYHLSLGAGLDPDNPSPQGVISRVVQGVRVYEE